MSDLNVYWGDFHKHLADTDHADAILEDAKYNLDFYPVLCYPFKWRQDRGLRVESVRQMPEFLEKWKRLRQATRDHNSPGKFVTFLGYEWHGNRTRWGDHNVIYFDPDDPLDDAWELEELYANLRTRKALAIPHHTAYSPENRGKDWSVLDPDLSPVMEVYSGHGCSEGVDSPVPLARNVYMGPRVTGGTFVDALDRGLRVGAIASNDGTGLPGSWNFGVAGLWAKDLTREALWDALTQRRTYAVTGDRIRLMFTINGRMMGSVIEGEEDLEATVNVTCAQPLDRIELIHNGVVATTYCHRGKWERGERGQGRYKVLMECGWGPAPEYGFTHVGVVWEGNVRVERGSLRSVQPRFFGFGQRYWLEDDTRCSFTLNTTRQDSAHAVQGLILEVEGDLDTRLALDIKGAKKQLRLRDLSDATLLVPLVEESEERIEKVFGVKREDNENPDVFYHNARKIRLNPAYPRESYTAVVKFRDLPVAEGNNYYYVRATQIDGQVAWSSPVWVTP